MTELDRWYAIQLVVVGLWVASVWAVRAGGPRANVWLRRLAAVALVLAVVPLPEPAAVRVVPVMERLGPIEPVATGVLRLSTAGNPVRVAFDGVGLVLVVAALLVFVFQLGRSVQLCATSTPRLRIGSVTVADAPVASPRTLWLGRHWVLLPPGMSRPDRDLAVRHELTHIRHRDTAWAWATALLCAFCAPNPFAWLFARNLAELDEHAVDHELVHRRRVSPRAYGSLLLSAAQGGPTVLQAAAGLSPRTSLHRRLVMLTQTRPSRVLPWLVASLLLGGVALARPSLPVEADLTEAITVLAPLGVRDHRLVDEAHHQLTRGRGRTFLKGALANRPTQQAFIEDALQDAGLPLALEAVALIESGYDPALTTSTPESDLPGGPIGAGLWMFIPQTAREYGLVVTPERDERLDRERETEAAMALLSDLYAEHGDWGLALAAYNQGSKKVNAAIEEVGTRDVLTLVEKGALNRYVPMVYAAMLVLEER